MKVPANDVYMPWSTKYSSSIVTAMDANFGCSSGSALPNRSALKKYRYASGDKKFKLRACVVPKFMISFDRLVTIILLRVETLLR
uniref:Uncharacterized protein n=1 Tax=Setaria italica TaxID=4555 RepID=K3ZYK1_SETIT